MTNTRLHLQVLIAICLVSVTFASEDAWNKAIETLREFAERNSNQGGGSILKEMLGKAAEGDEKLEKIKKTIRDFAAAAQNESRFVSDLQQTVEQLKPDGYNVVVQSMGQLYEVRWINGVLFETVEKFGRRYGVWVFQCGEFENKGDQSPTSWAFSQDHVYMTDQGEDAIFYHEDCPNQEYRYKYWKTR